MKNNDTLRTPKWVIDALGEFDLDPCAGANTAIGHKCIISEVIGKPTIMHCTIYRVDPKELNRKYQEWFFRHELKKIENESTTYEK